MVLFFFHLKINFRERSDSTKKIKSSLDSYSILESQVSKFVLRRIETRQTTCRYKLHPPTGNWHLVLPKTFREKRALLIAAWFLPDWLGWEIILSLEGSRINNLDFSAKGLKNSIELHSFREGKKITLLLLDQEIFFSKRELFGTILAEDLEKALSNLRIKKESTKKPRTLVRRKGYNDKGCWSRPDRRRTIGNDFTLLKEQEIIEKKKLLITLLSKTLILKIQEGK